MEKFFVVGPNRCGTTLLTRCIDDHPQCICLWESYAHHFVFGGKRSHDHLWIMQRHGLSKLQAKQLSGILKRRRVDSLMTWYDRCAEALMEIYEKPNVTAIGDKNPYFSSSNVIDHLKGHPKIWIIRDPRDVWVSGKFHKTGDRSRTYLNQYLRNVDYFWDRIKSPDYLVLKYEDLIVNPQDTMHTVYDFISVPYDESFLHHEKCHDIRFSWVGNAVSGFNSSNTHNWRSHKFLLKHGSDLGKIKNQINTMARNPRVQRILDRFYQSG